jgi:hypothetical protein
MFLFHAHKNTSHEGQSAWSSTPNPSTCKILVKPRTKLKSKVWLCCYVRRGVPSCEEQLARRHCQAIAVALAACFCTSTLYNVGACARYRTSLFVGACVHAHTNLTLPVVTDKGNLVGRGSSRSGIDMEPSAATTASCV